VRKLNSGVCDLLKTFINLSFAVVVLRVC